MAGIISMGRGQKRGKQTTFETHQMVDWDGQTYKIIQEDGQFFVLWKDDEDAIRTDTMALVVIKHYPNGYTICRAENGMLFDFNFNPKNPIMGKLSLAKELNSQGAFITSREMDGRRGKDGKTYAYVSGDNEDGLDAGERRQLEPEKFGELLDIVKDYEDSIRYQKQIEQKEIKDMESSLKLRAMGLSRVREKQNPNAKFSFVHARDGKFELSESHSVEGVPLDVLFDNRLGEAERKTARADQGVGYSIFKRQDNGQLLLDNLSPTCQLVIESYEPMSGQRAICQYKDDDGQIQHLYVNKDGLTADIDKNSASSFINKSIGYEYDAERVEEKERKLRDEKAVKAIPSFYEEKFNY